MDKQTNKESNNDKLTEKTQMFFLQKLKLCIVIRSVFCTFYITFIQVFYGISLVYLPSGVSEILFGYFSYNLQFLD